jgi:hypothetical protein
MKSLKQRFTQWINGTRGHRGMLWESRYKSVIVEDGYAALVISAYIDLTPVREGLVREPGDYPACGYSEAVAGSETARAGIKRVVLAGGGKAESWRQAITEYRRLLGSAKEWPASREELLDRLDAGEKLSLQELLRCRVRFFDDGSVIGSREFVDEVWVQNRERFGPRRKSGARPIRGCAEPIFSLRALQVRAIE